MIFSKKLIIGENVKSFDEIIEHLESGRKIILGFYLVVLADNQNILEIIPTHEVNKDRYKDREFNVIGIAESKKEAFLTVRDVIAAFVSKENDFNYIKTYLRNYYF